VSLIGWPARFGYSVASAGDVNGDSYSDVIIGAPLYSNGQEQEGAAFVFLGSASGLSSEFDWMAEGDQVPANFGLSVASAGDVNGDSYSDVIIGAPAPFYSNEQEGKAFVFLGSASGLSSEFDWMAEGGNSIARFGSSVASAGDVNGDSYSDVIIGAPGPYYSNEQEQEGKAFIFLGSSRGLKNNPDWTSTGDSEIPPAVGEGQPPSPAVGEGQPPGPAVGEGQPPGPGYNRTFGYSVASAGDVNGDGFSDIIISDPNYTSVDNTTELHYEIGRIYVYCSLGSPSAPLSVKSIKGPAPLEVTFDGPASTDIEGITGYEWILGDGGTSLGSVVMHTYPDPGIYFVKLIVTNIEGVKDTIGNVVITVTETNQSPIASFTSIPMSGEAPLEVIFDGTASIDPDGTIMLYTWDFGENSESIVGTPPDPDPPGGTGDPPLPMTEEVTINHTFEMPGTYVTRLTVTDDMGATATAIKTISVTSGYPTPDPVIIAPSLDRTVTTNLFTATEFLYTGDNPIQRGVVPGTIEPVRAAVIRGQVLNREGDPLSGVKITILGCLEYGYTLTREDGIFDMVVNGGGLLTVCYEKYEYLGSQRHTTVPWHDYAWLPDVVMIPADQQVTNINLNTNSPLQVARGSEVVDDDGRRQASLVFPQGTQAEFVLSNGNREPVNELSVSITEYTVGTTGPNSMPAELPPTSGYTYAVEYKAIEAAGAKEVRFDRPLIHYVENFLSFPVGMIVPTGYYDRDKGIWIPSDNGLVVKLLDTDENGIVDALDGSGDDEPDDLNSDGSVSDEVVGLTDPSLYHAGSTYWRVPISHFSPWDCNWPYGPPPDATSPGLDLSDFPDLDDPCMQAHLGSSIECQNQILGEAEPITGTPFKLHYQSDRVPGRKASYSLRIPLIGAEVPTSLKQVDLNVQIAGQQFAQSFPPLPNSSHTFTWDGLDAYGRTLQGAHQATVRLGYVYDGVYQEPAQLEQSFAAFSGIPLTANESRQEITFWQTWTTTLGPWGAKAMGLGGWTINVHHTYDHAGKILYLGDGTRRTTESHGSIITTIAGGGSVMGDDLPATEVSLGWLDDVIAAPDDIFYIAEGNSQIRRVGIDGQIKRVAGKLTHTHYAGDDGPANQAQFGVHDLAVGQDGSLYIADFNNSRIRRISPGVDGLISGDDDEIITTVAGVGIQSPYGESGHGFSGDGGPAILAQLNHPEGIAISPDGALYIADTYNHRIRRVGTNGIITTVAGSGLTGGSGGAFEGDGGPTTLARLNYPNDVAVDPDGNLYITDAGNHCIRRVSTDGVITTIAGTGVRGFNGEAGLATFIQLDYPSSVDVGKNGSLYIADYRNHRVRLIRPDGILMTIVGSGPTGGSSWSFEGDGGLATKARLDGPKGVSLGPNGNIYVADFWNGRIRNIEMALPGYTGISFALLSSNGREVYMFDVDGRHIQTVDVFTGTTILSFNYTEYNGNRLLTEIIDANNNVTCIEREPNNGEPIAIVSPYNQRNELALNSSGYLESITNPAGEVKTFTYKNNGIGLLETYTDPKNNVHTFSYDDMGMLTKHEDPPGTGSSLELLRTEQPNGYKLDATSAVGRTRTFQVEYPPGGGWHHIIQFPDSTQRDFSLGIDDVRHITNVHGTVSSVEQSPDPRWGMQAPFVTRMNVQTPGGRESVVTADREVFLEDPTNPLSDSVVIETWTVNGRLYTSKFDKNLGTLVMTTPEGRRFEVTINDHGRVIKEEMAGLPPIIYEYDSRGRLETVKRGTDANARITTYHYNTNPTDDGYLDYITDPEGRIWSMKEYDDSGRLKIIELPNSQQIGLSFDSNGNIETLKPPGRPTHTFTYTPINTIEQYIPPDISILSTVRNDYNEDKQVDLITRADGKRIDLEFDPVKGRLDHISALEDNTEIERLEFSYYPQNNPSEGHLSSITTSSNEALSFTYDGFLLESSNLSGTINGNVERDYDNDFRVVSETINGGHAVSFSYDNDGLLKQAGQLILTRDDPSQPDTRNGLLRSTTLLNVTTSIEYNEFGEVSKYAVVYNNEGDPTTLFESLYSIRDKLGRIEEKTEILNGGTKTYNYDYYSSGELWRVYKDEELVREYKYDENGNRLLFTQENTLDVEYDDQDRLLRYSVTTYTYGANGELETETNGTNQTIYTYNVFGNLSHIELADGTNIEYVVDGSNRRIGKKINGVLVQGFLYGNQPQPVAELDGAGNVLSRFVYATRGNVPDYMVKNGVVYRIISDHLGSPRVIVDAWSGEIVQKMSFDEFGNILEDSNPGFQPFGFGGGLYDSLTNKIRFYARDYDPVTGRWIAKDAIWFSGGDVNLYRYVFNDPVNFIDPFGKNAFGASIDFSSINPYTSGRGGVYGNNIQYTPTEGWEIYDFGTPNDVTSFGSDIGMSATINFAAGEGPWTGKFETSTISIPVYGSIGIQVGYFQTPCAWFNALNYVGNNEGYVGIQLGVSVGSPFKLNPLPFSFSHTQTEYTTDYPIREFLSELERTMEWYFGPESYIRGNPFSR
jgi:RHS repeat-associated protein